LTKTKKPVSFLFISAAVVLACAFIGYDYLKLQAVNCDPVYTIALITDFRGSVREFNHTIHYAYLAEGSLKWGEFRDRMLTPDLKGKFVVVKYYRRIPGWSCVIVTK